MTDNEKAAIAAGLWEPGRECEGCTECRPFKGFHYTHNILAPDMHDPANLWQALENLMRAGLHLGCDGHGNVIFWEHANDKTDNTGCGQNIGPKFVKALVELHGKRAKH